MCPNNQHVTDSFGEDFYMTLFKQHHLPVLIIRPSDGQIIDVNEAAETFYLYDREIFKTMSVFDINTLPDEIVRQNMSSAIGKEKSLFHFHHQTKIGDIREVKVNSIPVTYQGVTLLFSVVTEAPDSLEKYGFFQTLFEQSPYAIMMMDRKYQIQRVNHHFESLFGYFMDEVIGKNPVDIVYPKQHLESYHINKEKMEQGIVITENTVRKTKSGELINVQLVAMPVYSDQLLIATCVIYIDKRKETALKAYNQMLASVLENTNQGVVITDADGKIEWINDAYTSITGYHIDDVLGENPRILQSGKHSNDFYQDMWYHILSYGSWAGEIWNRRKNGEVFPEYLKIFSIKDDTNQIVRFVGIFIDNTEMKSQERTIDVLETKDTLTNLYNRSFITKYIDEWIVGEHEPELTLLYIDIDKFKIINDNLSHLVGDNLLTQFSHRLKETFSSSLLARVSGDEFVVIGFKKDDKEMSISLQKFFTYLKKPFDLGHYHLLITCSVGVAYYPNDGHNSSHLLMHADIAMFEAKKQEGNSVVYYDVSLTKKANRVFEVKTALQQADFNEEFTLKYQPIIDLKTDEVIGVEALLRFNHQKLGLLSPGEFIPIAEKHGLILPIGKWVLEQACSSIGKVIQSSTKPFTLAVNISVQQLENTHFPEMLQKILKYTRFPSRFLTLEVTEETSVSHSERVKETINTVEGLGVGVAIDDFGTGFSSLEKLHHLKVNALKIDQSFIKDLDQTEPIVHAILAMGKSLGLAVVAEGIETKAQRDFLKATTCNYGQGYFYSRPLSLEDFKTYLVNNQSSS